MDKNTWQNGQTQDKTKTKEPHSHLNLNSVTVIVCKEWWCWRRWDCHQRYWFLEGAVVAAWGAWAELQWSMKLAVAPESIKARRMKIFFEHLIRTFRDWKARNWVGFTMEVLEEVVVLSAVSVGIGNLLCIGWLATTVHDRGCCTQSHLSQWT